MKDYHPYVFDEEKRQFVGRFEEMYRAEREQGFDSWHQDDLRDLTKRISLAILDSYNFWSILDVGCGKGAFTQRLKKQNNRVVGIDLSQTALDVARARCPDIEFVQADLGAPDWNPTSVGSHFDLVVCLETLSYLSNWPQVLGQFAAVADHALVALYIPDDPIGFVKSADELAAAFARHFVAVEDIRLLTRRQIVLFGRKRE